MSAQTTSIRPALGTSRLAIWGGSAIPLFQPQHAGPRSATSRRPSSANRRRVPCSATVPTRCEETADESPERPRDRRHVPPHLPLRPETTPHAPHPPPARAATPRVTS